MKRRLAFLAVLALSACGTPSAIPPPAPTPGPAPTPSPALPPPSVAVPKPPLPPPDACGASRLQHLVGHSRREIPVPVDPSKQRVACTVCPVTLDYRPERLNFFFDAQTGVIKEIKCG